MRCQPVDGPALLLLELVVEDVEVVEGALLGVVIGEPVVGLAELLLLIKGRVDLVVQKACFAFPAELWAFSEGDVRSRLFGTEKGTSLPDSLWELSTMADHG